MLIHLWTRKKTFFEPNYINAMMHTRYGFFCFREKLPKSANRGSRKFGCSCYCCLHKWRNIVTPHQTNLSQIYIYAFQPILRASKSKLDSSELKHVLNLFWSPCQMGPCHWTKPGLRWQQLPNHSLRPSYRLIGWSLPNDWTSRWIQRSKHVILTLQKR